MDSTPGPARLPERPESPGANKRKPRCPMAVSPFPPRLWDPGPPTPQLPTLKTWAPECLSQASPPGTHRLERQSRRRSCRGPRRQPAPALEARLPPPELPSSRAPERCEFSSPFFFEGTFFCVASGRLPGDRRAIPPPASRRRRPPPIQAAAGRPPGTAGLSAPGS